MHCSVGIVLQARLGSRRLPHKALALVRGRTILEHCVRRLAAADAGTVVVATTDRPEDDELVVRARRLSVSVFRGSAEDVLDRFARCAAAYQFEWLVRATADNPGVDVEAPRRVLALLRETGADYACETGLPHGGGVEAITCEALCRAATLARDPYDREHVTTFVKRRTDLFRVATADAPAPLARPDVRLTVDTVEDLDRLRTTYLDAGLDVPSIADLIEAWDRDRERSVA